ncbi:hypothetical protein F3Y22_tig00110988pilonHSYRG00141 [Hibiscus syriacus]|uniref:AWPM-19-like family protein n=1 Tax=Hibiscus syriacus TaxID=106335 RepID=A0A6A2ZAZ2_HIBSY|nr:hypothetical protein F3Y22_tig00110988pilonHSYRG00141 [Hibiscus syriacus]
MANAQMKPVAALLLFLNFCMYAIVLGIGSWAVNKAIDNGFIIAGVVGVASVIAGTNHIHSWHAGSLPSAASIACVAWTLTLLAMGFACKEIELQVRNARLITMEAFIIILTVTQLFYIAAIQGGA